MKSFITSLVVFGAIVASAAEAAENSAYTLPAGVVAQYVGSSIFASPTAPISSGVRILDDCSVIKFAEYDNRPTINVTLGTLSPDSLRAIKASMVGLKVSELVQADPEAPECMDAGSEAYIGRNGQDVAVGLRSVYDCKDYRRTDGAYVPVVEILSGFRTLAFMK